MMDFLKKRKLRKQLKEYTENLERLIREKTELQDNLSNLGLMVGSISHGIKGLLTGLDGGLYLLGSGLKTKDLIRIGEGSDILKMMVDRIRRMVSDILFYAKYSITQYPVLPIMHHNRTSCSTHNALQQDMFLPHTGSSCVA